MLKEKINKTFKCDWLPTGTDLFCLGRSYTGPSMVGVAFIASKLLEGLV